MYGVAIGSHGESLARSRIRIRSGNLHVVGGVGPLSASDHAEYASAIQHGGSVNRLVSESRRDAYRGYIRRE